MGFRDSEGQPSIPGSGWAFLFWHIVPQAVGSFLGAIIGIAAMLGSLSLPVRSWLCFLGIVPLGVIGSFLSYGHFASPLVVAGFIWSVILGSIACSALAVCGPALILRCDYQQDEAEGALSKDSNR